MWGESQRRGGCLSLLLMFYILGGGLLILAGLINILFPNTNISDSRPLISNVWQLVLGLCNIAFGVAAWRWKKWGVFGLGATITIGFVVGFSLNAAGNILLFILPLVQIVLLIYLVRPKWESFE